jgi:hypothetical protein
MFDVPIKIFVNYRRADHRDFVEHIRTWFMHRYGRENVFMDFDTIPPFARFESFIRQKVRECDVVVAIIGPRWLELMHQKTTEGQPDYVRIELEEAIKHGKVVAPLCIQGARVPPEKAIPANLRVIFQRNVPSLRSGRDIIENIHGIMDALETTLVEQGNGPESFFPADPKTDLQNLAQHHALSFDIYAAIGHFYEAEANNDLPAALLWLNQIRESGEHVPPFLKLDETEAALRNRLKGEEQARHRREVADYHYGLVQLMVQYNRPRHEIIAALHDVWAIEDGYDPDGLGANLQDQDDTVTSEWLLDEPLVDHDGDGVPDWMMDVPTPESSGDGVPDWMHEVGTTPDSDRHVPDWIMDAPFMDANDKDLPDWLSGRAAADDTAKSR